MDIAARVNRRDPVDRHTSGADLVWDCGTGTLIYRAFPGGDRSRVLSLWLGYRAGLMRRHAARPQSPIERVRALLDARRLAGDLVASLSRLVRPEKALPAPPALVLLESTRPVHGPPALPA